MRLIFSSGTGPFEPFPAVNLAQVRTTQSEGSQLIHDLAVHMCMRVLACAVTFIKPK